MLRITQAIEVAFRKKESIFSRDFKKGLLLALLLHLTLLLVFKIVTPPNLDLLKTLSPIPVEVDLSAHEIEVLPQAKSAHFPVGRLYPPSYFDTCLAAPSLPKMISFTPKKIEILDPNFSEIEKIEYHPINHFFKEESHD